MTNGEKIIEIFPNFLIDERSHTAWVGYEAMSFRRDWWNAEYKEPTTKTDLGVDNQNIRLIDANALIKRLLPKHFDWWGEDEQEQDDFSKGNNSMLEEVIEAIEEFPSVTSQEPRWIPVSERLPEKSGYYWCTFGGTNLTGSDYYTTELDAKEIYDEPEENVGWRSQNVVAWMLKPQPYREVKE